MLSHARYGRLIRILGAWSVFALLIGCGFLQEDAETTEPEPVAAEVEAVDEPAAEPAAGGGACSRMAPCCRAYVEAMGGSLPPSTCDAYNDVAHMPDSMCEQTMAGYRAGLQAMQKSVPEACN